MLLSFGGTKDQAPIIRPMLPRLVEGLRQTDSFLAPEHYPWMFENFGPEVSIAFDGFQIRWGGEK